MLKPTDLVSQTFNCVEGHGVIVRLLVQANHFTHKGLDLSITEKLLRRMIWSKVYGHLRPDIQRLYELAKEHIPPDDKIADNILHRLLDVIDYDRANSNCQTGTSSS